MTRMRKMLLLDQNKTPQNTVYYLSAVIMGLLAHNDNLDYIELLERLEIQSKRDVNPIFFGLALNFLYLIDKIRLDERGNLHVS
ncbi:ABC-three component system middle component 6 [Lacticaseibacillus rhamnosus]|uniref:ABC-three component system middle component 6 n=2 Tax=Lacticaseibacillus rhamnosus TaxID=47715 RepID=UPI003786FABD